MSGSNTLRHRLSLLPAKTGVAFQRLYETGLIAEDALAAILDAGAITGDTARLLGFAVAYHHLQAQGAPVADVIRMARTQNRRVNLGWSARRWKAEHDRLSRAETLQRLAQENVVYDISKFEALLPRDFSGYLIRTSRRLGMEGLRQRHCVASYHDMIKAGRCAIAAVFVDRRRWTVELVETAGPEAELRIAQIKTRLNGLASNDVRERIHEMLGVDPKAAAPAGGLRPMPQERHYLQTLRSVLPILREHGVRRVHVSFDGAGDSGSIDYVDYEDGEIDAEAVMVEHQRVSRRFGGEGWIVETERVRCSVDEAIKDLTYDYLDETQVDWYNNDGGFGSLVIDVANGTVSLEVNVRFTESSTEFSSELSIETGEEE